MEKKMKQDYRDSIEFGFTKINPEVYEKSLEFQKYLLEKGIAWHNPFSDECTPGFECCIPNAITIHKVNFRVPMQGKLTHSHADGNV